MTTRGGLVVFLALVACGGDGPPSPRDLTTTPRPDDAAAPGSGNARVAAYEAIYARLASCPSIDSFVSRDCPAEQELFAAWGRASDGRNPDAHAEIAAYIEAARRRMSDAHPIIRFVAIREVNALTEDWVTVAEAVARETDREVLIALARAIAPWRHPALAAQAFRLAEHADPAIRQAALGSLATPRPTVGAFDTLREHALADADVGAREVACRELGMLGDPRALPVLEEILVPTTAPPLYAECFSGLLAMWMRNRDEAAYRFTLRLVPAPDHPVDVYFTPLVELGQLRQLLDDGTFASDRPFFRVAQVEKALAALAASPARAVGTRDAAADALAELRGR